MLRIELEGSRSSYRPGSMLIGRIVWEFHRAPDEISASLRWLTEGKGEVDTGTVIEQHWRPASESGSISFRWRLPRGPISFDGKLIRVGWKIECFSQNPDEEVSAAMVLSYLDSPLRTPLTP